MQKTIIQNYNGGEKADFLCLAHMSEAGLEQKYIEEAFDTNWVVPLGPNVIGFEKDLEDLVNEIQNENEKLSKRVVALSSGTVAVHLRMHRLRQWCVRVCLQSWYVLA